jgi:hypothetical protein
VKMEISLQTLLLYLLRAEVIAFFLSPIVGGLLACRRTNGVRRAMTIAGVLLGALLFTYYISLRNPTKLTNIAAMDWLVAGFLGLFCFALVRAFGRLL